MKQVPSSNEASSDVPALDDGLERLRLAAGIELEDSFESGSKWAAGDDELTALVAVAKAEEREACAARVRQLAEQVERLDPVSPEPDLSAIDWLKRAADACMHANAPRTRGALPQ